ncbi:MAG: Na(+)/H(+) antiporter subunit B [Verrucomicrobia bacterium]|jgi:multisubunit Na+/H+ antiporter MnhB subunit|nr:Na(+)/H(+) antiporter subunit B [Verrucomicrobiota bacterium]
MKWFALSQAGRILFPWLVVLSLIVLYRGHNLPGGGFIGGLLGAAAFILVGLGDGMAEAKRRLRLDPVTVLGIGLGVAVLSGLPGLFGEKKSYFVDQWLPDFTLPLLGEMHIGTPFVFDVGVYIVVVGFVLHAVFSLDFLAKTDSREELEKDDKPAGGAD